MCVYTKSNRSVSSSAFLRVVVIVQYALAPSPASLYSCVVPVLPATAYASHVSHKYILYIHAWIWRCIVLVRFVHSWIECVAVARRHISPHFVLYSKSIQLYSYVCLSPARTSASASIPRAVERESPLLMNSLSLSFRFGCCLSLPLPCGETRHSALTAAASALELWLPPTRTRCVVELVEAIEARRGEAARTPCFPFLYFTFRSDRTNVLFGFVFTFYDPYK